MKYVLVAFVLAVLATSNLFVPNLTGTVLTDPTVLALGAASLLVANAWVADRGYVGRPHLLIALAGITFAPGILRAADHSYGASKTLGLAMTFVILVVMTQLLTHPATRKAFVQILGGFGVLVAGMLLVLGDTASFGGRTSVMGLNPIDLGRMASLGAMLCLLGAIWTRGPRRLVLVAAAALCGYAAMSTGSRAPLIAAGLAIGAALLLNRRPGSKIVRLVGIGALIAGGYAFLRSGGIDSSNRLLSTNTSGRDTLWRESATLAWENPQGLGFGGLYGHISLSPAAKETGVIQYSHNALLETAVEGGWIALAGLLLLLVVSFRALLANSRTHTGALLLSVWVFAVVNALASSDLVGNRIMWTMIGAGLAVQLWQLRGEKTSEDAPLAAAPAVSVP